MSIINFIQKQQLIKKSQFIEYTLKEERKRPLNGREGVKRGHKRTIKEKLNIVIDELLKLKDERNEIHISAEEIGRKLNIKSGSIQYRMRLLNDNGFIEFFTPPKKRKCIRVLTTNTDFLNNLKIQGKNNAK